jgi:hypothetical protein
MEVIAWRELPNDIKEKLREEIDKARMKAASLKGQEFDYNKALIDGLIMVMKTGNTPRTGHFVRSGPVRKKLEETLKKIGVELVPGKGYIPVEHKSAASLLVFGYKGVDLKIVRIPNPKPHEKPFWVWDDAANDWLIKEGSNGDVHEFNTAREAQEFIKGYKPEAHADKTEKHGEIDGKIYFHGEIVKDTAPETLDKKRGFGELYKESSLEVESDDIGYYYSDQDGGSGAFYSIVTDDIEYL